MADIHTFIGRHKHIDIEVTIAADFDILTDERSRELNAFWIDSEVRLALCDDDHRLSVVRMAAENFIQTIAANDSMSVRDVNREFYASDGWGDYLYNGIILVEYDSGLDLNFDTIEIEEIEGDSQEAAKPC